MRWVVLAWALTGCGWFADAAPEALPPAVFVDPPDDAASLPELIRQTDTEARASGRLPFVQVWADWCEPCRELRDAMDDPRMVDAFAGTRVLRLEHTAWSEALRAELPDTEGVVSVPAFYEIEAGGVLGAELNGHAWSPNTPEAMAPPLKAFFRAARR